MIEFSADERRGAFDAAVRAINAVDALDDPAREGRLVTAVHDHVAKLINPARIASGSNAVEAAGARDLARWVRDEVMGLGPVEPLLRDPLVEEIAASRWDLVFVYRSDGSVTRLPESPWSSERELVDWLARTARTKSRTERSFNAQSPLLVMDLGDGLRLAAQRDVSQHVGFTLRRNTLKQASLDELAAGGMMAAPMAGFLAAVMRSSEMRVVFAGATGAGKTTLTRACLEELPPMCRVVTIEDTAELALFDERRHPNVESWEARLANAEGAGRVTLGDLVRQGLRARPDWLVVGECRDDEAAVPMLAAMTHGQSSLTTVHSPSAREALDKLALYLMMGGMEEPVAHQQLSMAVDFVVHVARTGRGRRVTELVEVDHVDNGRVGTNVLWSATGAQPVAMTQRRAEKLRAVGFDHRLLLAPLRTVGASGR